MKQGPVKKIMIVDDEPSILLSLAYALRADGVEVIVCNAVEEAEEALETTSFDLVIADIRMSGVDGIEGLGLLSYVKEKYATDVIIMTGHGNDEMETEAYRRGALHYYEKPLDVEDLLARVASLGIPTKKNKAMTT